MLEGRVALILGAVVQSHSMSFLHLQDPQVNQLNLLFLRAFPFEQPVRLHDKAT